jgi:hypothetical protein
MHENEQLIQEHFELLEVELRPENLFDVYGVATFEVEKCECTSTAGNQEVTQRWNEYHLQDVLILELYYLAGKDQDIPHPIPTCMLSEADINLIKDIVPQYEP